MSDFKLESVGADYAQEPTDKERADRVKAIAQSDVYSKLGMWDRDFLTDIYAPGRVHGAYTGAQRHEIDRIWKQWGHLV